MPTRIALILAIVALGVASGCGGDDEESTAETVPTTPELTVPGEDEAPTVTDTGRDRDRTSTTDDGGSGGTAAPAPGAGGGSTPAPQQPQQPSGGAPAPGQGGQTPQRNAPNTGGQEGRFEQFCQDNPGAC